MRSTKPKYHASKITLYKYRDSDCLCTIERWKIGGMFIACTRNFLTNACSESDNQNTSSEMVDISGRDYGKFECVKVGIQIMKIMLFS